MKFHLNQKVIIKDGFYKTYKGKIIDFIENKDHSVFYKVFIIPKKEDGKSFNVEKSISEDSLRQLWFFE